MFAKIKEAYHKLYEEERKEFMRKNREKMEELVTNYISLLTAVGQTKSGNLLGLRNGLAWKL